MNKTSIAAMLGLLVAATSAQAGPLAKVTGALPALPSLKTAPVGLNVAGLNLAGKQGKGLLAGAGVLGGSGVGHGIVGASVLSGSSSGVGLVGLGVASGTGAGQGLVGIGVGNAGQSKLHVAVLGKNVIGH